MADIIHEKQDLTYLNWTRVRNSSGTAGSFLKAYSENEGKKLYYKLSNYDVMNGIVGHECVNEIIVDRLLTMLGIEHLSYTLINADIIVDGQQISTYLCMSENFRKPGEDKTALDTFYEMERQRGESPLDFCIRKGWAEYIRQMLVVDFLILNRDRHGANIEVLRDKKRRTVRLAPLFDHGLSLLSLCRSENDIAAYDVMEDKPVQCFVGSHSAKDNLGLIPFGEFPSLSPLHESDKDKLLDGLDDIIPTALTEKIWDMIWKRWCYYEDLCNKKR
ncbi:MAG: hypothetical protein IK093_04310 [Ruminiclostridium sp.]|nr:hypothetical protein [Ruminiclostridium sp.]